MADEEQPEVKRVTASRDEPRFRLLAPQWAVDAAGHEVWVENRETLAVKAPGYAARVEAELGSVVTVYLESLADLDGREYTPADREHLTELLRAGLTAMGAVRIDLV